MDALTILETRIRENAVKYFPQLAGRDVTLRRSPLRAGSNRLYRWKLQANGHAGLAVELVAKFAPRPLFIEFEHFVLLSERGTAPAGALRVPRPLDYFADINALLTENVGGQPLARLVWNNLHVLAGRGQRDSIARWMRLSGQWLANYHGLTRGPDAAPFDQPWLESTGDKVRELEQAGFPGSAGAAARRTLSRLHEAGARMTAPYAHRHGDFSLSNIHVGDGWVCVFDINDRRSVCVYEDLAFFVVTLETMNRWPRHPLFDRRAAVAMRTPFLEGYFGSMAASSSLLLEGHILEQLLFRCAKQRRNRARRSRATLAVFDAVLLRRAYPRRILEQCARLDRLLGAM